MNPTLLSRISEILRIKNEGSRPWKLYAPLPSFLSFPLSATISLEPNVSVPEKQLQMHLQPDVWNYGDQFRNFVAPIFPPEVIYDNSGSPYYYLMERALQTYWKLAEGTSRNTLRRLLIIFDPNIFICLCNNAQKIIENIWTNLLATMFSGKESLANKRAWTDQFVPALEIN